MPFAISRIWREPKNHLNDCYFCMVNLPKCKSDHKYIIYPNILSSIALVDHYDDLPIPVPPDNEHSTRGYSSYES